MPASTKIPSKYKSYIGRVFILRKYRFIPVSEKMKVGKRHFIEREKKLGDVCLVLDETYSRVKVTNLEGGSYWISKYYLRKELEGTVFSKYDNVLSLIDKLLGLCYCNQEDTEIIKEAAKNLRAYADILKPNNKD